MFVSKTPLRVSLFGGGTDYPSYFKSNEAGVIGGTIDKFIYTFISELPQEATQKYRINYRVSESVNKVADISHPIIREGLRLFAGDTSLNISTMSDLVGGSGLGSSSAFTVGFLNALSCVRGDTLLRSELWRHAVHLERNVLNENGGIQDQIHASIGGFKYYRFLPDSVSSEDLLDGKEKLNFLSESCFLLKTGGTRKSFEIAIDQSKRTDAKDNTIYLGKMMSVLAEAKSIFGASEFNERSIADIGELLLESWRLKRNLGSEVSNREVDGLIEAVTQMGAYGSKLLGAGGSGYLLILANPRVAYKIKERFANLGVLDFSFNDRGSEAWGL